MNTTKSQHTIGLTIHRIVIMSGTYLLRGYTTNGILVNISNNRPIYTRNIGPMIPRNARYLNNMTFVPPLTTRHVTSLPNKTGTFNIRIPTRLRHQNKRRTSYTGRRLNILINSTPLMGNQIVVILFPLIRHLNNLTPTTINIPTRMLNRLPITNPIIRRRFTIISKRPPRSRPLHFRLLYTTVLRIITLLSVRSTTRSTGTRTPRSNRLYTMRNTMSGRGRTCRHGFCGRVLPRRHTSNHSHRHRRGTKSHLKMTNRHTMMRLPHSTTMRGHGTITNNRHRHHTNRPRHKRGRNTRPGIKRHPRPSTGHIVPQLTNGQITMSHTLTRSIRRGNRRRRQRGNGTTTLIQRSSGSSILRRSRRTRRTRSRWVRRIVRTTSTLLLITMVTMSMKPPMNKGTHLGNHSRLH